MEPMSDSYHLEMPVDVLHVQLKISLYQTVILLIIILRFSMNCL